MIVEGTLFHLDRANIDTDQIIPAKYLGASRAEMGEFCFAGVPGVDAIAGGHGGARIVVAGENFGCGSSREHAVWALQSRGYHAVIAPSFARIFEENSYNNAFVPAVVAADAMPALFAATAATIDVATERVTLSSGASFPISLDPMRKEFLLGGGFLAYMAGQIGHIRAWEAAQRR